MKYAFPDLARRGLCNMLFTWAQAVSYCHHFNAKMLAPVWVRFSRIGPWLRGERYKRFYGGEFTNKGYVSGAHRWWLLHFRRKSVKTFSGMEGFFDSFLNDYEIIKKELYRIVSSRIMIAVQRIAEEGPYVAVHVRRGDFSAAGLATPDCWYIKAIEVALKFVADSGVPIHFIRVFTDGYPEEVRFIADAFPDFNVIIMGNAPAIHDVLAMSKAQVLVCTAESTFSMWAVFLGQMPSVWHKGQFVPNLYVRTNLSMFV